MAKKCIICEENASYKIKDTPDFYCEECAEENFSDLNLLVKVEEEAHRLKEIIKEKLDEILEKEKLFRSRGGKFLIPIPKPEIL